MSLEEGDDLWTEHESANEAARVYNLKASLVNQCATKRRHTHGYEFRWLPQLPDLPGEVWTDLLLPTTEYDPERPRVYES